MEWMRFNTSVPLKGSQKLPGAFPAGWNADSHSRKQEGMSLNVPVSG